MTGRRTIEMMQACHDRGWHTDDTLYLSPADAGALCFRSHLADCLTHLTRFVTITHCHRDRPIPLAAHEWVVHSFHAQCGVMMGSKAQLVDPATELFGCAACITAAERYGDPTFSLVPNRGCEQSAGRRGRTAARRAVDR